MQNILASPIALVLVEVERELLREIHALLVEGWMQCSNSPVSMNDMTR